MSHPVSKRKIIGALLAFVPIPFLVTVLAGYAISSFVIKQMIGSGAVQMGSSAGLVRFLLGISAFVGLLSLIAIPVGIYLLVKRDTHFIRALRRQPLYESMSEEHLDFVTHASLAAFLNPFVWAFGNHLYWWAMGLLVPFWGMYVWARLIVDGRRLSFEKGWSHFAHFEKSQKTLLQVIGLMILLQVLIPILLSVSLPLFFALFLSGQASTKTDTNSVQPFDQQNTSLSCSASVDTDRDLLTDFEERFAFHTDPNKADTDDDGFDDFSEVAAGYDAGSVDNKTLADTDADGLSDMAEKKFYASERDVSDTDGDGVSDADEVKNGSSPVASGETLATVKAAREAGLKAYDEQCAQK